MECTSCGLCSVSGGLAASQSSQGLASSGAESIAVAILISCGLQIGLNVLSNDNARLRSPENWEAPLELRQLSTFADIPPNCKAWHMGHDMPRPERRVRGKRHALEPISCLSRAKFKGLTGCAANNSGPVSGSVMGSWMLGTARCSARTCARPQQRVGKTELRDSALKTRSASLLAGPVPSLHDPKRASRDCCRLQPPHPDMSQQSNPGTLHGQSGWASHSNGQSLCWPWNFLDPLGSKDACRVDRSLSQRHNLAPQKLPGRGTPRPTRQLARCVLKTGGPNNELIYLIICLCTN